ncbi:cytochrome c [Planctomicrobium sp. SH664]|uniref:c-type cytochrome n=1 Tax=Planctomicrobium sp. SH664 TaxID=3448125 RepID=UPI003F5C5593
MPTDRMHHTRPLLIVSFLCCSLWTKLLAATEPTIQGDPSRGYQFLLDKAYLPRDFDEESLSAVWQVWPEPLRSQAEQASPLERRKMIFARYGLTPRAEVDLATTTDEQFKPLQYVVNQKGQWIMNCFTCHGGQVLGKTIPGLPNTEVSLETLSEDLRQLKTDYLPERSMGRMEKALDLFPLGTTRGSTNAVMFGVMLMTLRDADLNVRMPLGIPKLVHHDMTAPPWWHYRKKSHLYVDAYAERGHRGLMQFMLVRSNGPEKFREWEPDFRDIHAYLESLEAPAYPFKIDRQLADQGEIVFQQHCATCHGTYGPQESYPNRVIPIDDIGTDPVRFHAIPEQARAMYGATWFADYGKQETRSETSGYLAPPLDGVWATAPYLHNGSVPTLWHLLHPDNRPVVWKRIDREGYDEERGGLVIEELDAVPSEVTLPAERRHYFDTRGFGKSNSGHDYPDALTEAEKEAVLEYLKSL